MKSIIQTYHHIPLKIGALFLMLTLGCSSDAEPEDMPMEDVVFDTSEARVFQMGFTTWPFAPTQLAVDETNAFLMANGDIYSEHIDSEIPWSAWINDTDLPIAFTDMVAHRTARRTSGTRMTLSISLLNLDRNDLMPDFDGQKPDYTALNDETIVEAYHKHVRYLVAQLQPEYLVIAVEVDGLLKNAPEKWAEYKLLISNVKSRIKTEYPTLPIAESVMLHNFYRPDYDTQQSVIDEVGNYVNTMDFAAISFYPFLKGLQRTSEVQQAFDFLHAHVDVPIAFAETGHLSEDLSIEGFDLFIPGTESGQATYMQTLFTNAQAEHYEYIIWWTHRDYDPLWETFPEDLKDLGKIWISTGILNEDGVEKQAYSSWKAAFSK